MREMRQDARELDGKQSELNQAIESDRESTFRSLSDEGQLKEAIDEMYRALGEVPAVRRVLITQIV